MITTAIARRGARALYHHKAFTQGNTKVIVDKGLGDSKLLVAVNSSYYDSTLIRYRKASIFIMVATHISKEKELHICISKRLNRATVLARVNASLAYFAECNKWSHHTRLIQPTNKDDTIIIETRRGHHITYAIHPITQLIVYNSQTGRTI